MAGVRRPADPLQGNRERARRIELHHQLHRADVDPQLQRGGRDDRLHFRLLELLLGDEAHPTGKAAVVGAHLVFADPLAQRVGDPLHLPARVDEDQRGAVLPDQLGDPVAHLVPLLLRGHRGQLLPGQLDAQVVVALAAHVDHGAAGPPAGLDPVGPDQEARDLLDGPLGRGQADAHRPDRAERLQPLEREREVRAALVPRDRVDLVDDHRPRGGQHPPAARRGEQDVQRLGRRDQDVRRRLRHPLALRRGGIAGAHRRADVGHAQRAQLGQRLEEVLAHVVGQRLEGRDVDDLHLFRERIALPDHRVQAGEEGSQSLARPGGGRDQRVLAGLDARPAGRLWLGRAAEAPLEPVGDGGMEAAQHGDDCTAAC